MVRLDILQDLGLHIPDPYAYEVCALSGEAFEALVEGIRVSQQDVWNSAYVQGMSKSRVLEMA